MATFPTWRSAYLAFMEFCSGFYSEKHFSKVVRLTREKVSLLMLQNGFSWVSD